MTFEKYQRLISLMGVSNYKNIAEEIEKDSNLTNDEKNKLIQLMKAGARINPNDPNVSDYLTRRKNVIMGERNEIQREPEQNEHVNSDNSKGEAKPMSESRKNLIKAFVNIVVGKYGTFIKKDRSMTNDEYYNLIEKKKKNLAKDLGLTEEEYDKANYIVAEIYIKEFEDRENQTGHIKHNSSQKQASEEMIVDSVLGNEVPAQPIEESKQTSEIRRGLIKVLVDFVLEKYGVFTEKNKSIPNNSYNYLIEEKKKKLAEDLVLTKEERNIADFILLVLGKYGTFVKKNPSITIDEYCDLIERRKKILAKDFGWTKEIYDMVDSMITEEYMEHFETEEIGEEEQEQE